MSNPSESKTSLSVPLKLLNVTRNVNTVKKSPLNVLIVLLSEKTLQLVIVKILTMKMTTETVSNVQKNVSLVLDQNPVLNVLLTELHYHSVHVQPNTSSNATKSIVVLVHKPVSPVLLEIPVPTVNKTITYTTVNVSANVQKDIGLTNPPENVKNVTANVKLVSITLPTVLLVPLQDTSTELNV
jgi:hypothetical protein